MRQFGLRQRFILVIVLLFLVLFGGIATILVVRTAGVERSRLNEQSKTFATLATKPIGDTFLLYKDSGSVRIQQQITKFTDLNPDITGVSIVDTNGAKKFTSGTTPNISASMASSFEPIYQTKKGSIHTIVTPLIEDYGVHRYAMVYEISDSRLVASIQRTVASIALLSVIALAVAIVLTYQLLNVFFISPVRIISAKALKISNGNLEDQIQLKRDDELGALASAVNTMANSLKADIVKLQEADRLKTEFITISSHNLRTPLTIIKGDVEMMEGLDVSAEIKAMTSSISSSTAKLGNFIDDLLAISSMESGKLAVSEMRPAPLKDLLDRIADDYSHAAHPNNLQFNVDLDLGDEQVTMNQHLLKMAFVNLVENAFKFTKTGSVSIKARAEQGQAIVEFTDTGIGIAADEVPKLFTKFHRGTSVLEYNYEGTGIGLYLTKLIITDHHGTISVVSHEGQGTTFTVSLPLTAS
ncbi:MAG: hypothetical protein JWL89_5 [Candidatus Saccharibacteria bacterium]|nr:hypothetical protein [Candidatus Saccharibacteria bacterium]